jgi:hypothetical protein
MKNSIFKIATMIAFLFGVAMVFTQCEANQSEMNSLDNLAVQGRNQVQINVDPCTCIAQNFPYESLTQEEKDALTFMLEEEKVARDIYSKMSEFWNMQVFTNINKSEQKHMDAIECLMEKYDLELVGFDNTVGVFNNPDLQKAYDDLLAKGANSVVDALEVGAFIEDLDINDLMTNYDRIDNADITAVFENLERGSRNHMRAFVNMLDRYNETYTPQFITQEYFDYIISTSKEKGEGICDNCTNNGTGTCPNDGPNNPNNGPNNGPNGPGRGNGRNGG